MKIKHLTTVKKTSWQGRTPKFSIELIVNDIFEWLGALSIHQWGFGFVYSDTYCILVVANDGIFLNRIKTRCFYIAENKKAVFWIRIKNVKNVFCNYGQNRLAKNKNRFLKPQDSMFFCFSPNFLSFPSTFLNKLKSQRAKPDLGRPD